ncbi:bifunctional phosphopantothenoylcysteine decarboxylase/phosphopantothenate--cysteine ligase CoaBC [Agreia pratensis]|uniref:bifunctional phosphopantothenoylcysteine decarboxylase/phosphopantothenate--cysteine ligase CoaBC n=1 Tax=Agreia pratensis TaxID=150121 RepID=UPI00188B4170|nr:bifunctional phosphopantothenoylcysteine decarboxylase/phosphopantothenate--cysteine ligase CoaBC [Agreia pratensis]MBF4634137.1 bifunctional phosphopantothenoylcysteine decarboxylase/phosphopantothenate--cysteine ligase CoaBC [Agreia pratensis]
MRIVVGITGGIAAYKAVGVVRAFVLAGHDVQVVATEHALRFVGKPTLEAISRNVVHTDLYEAVAEVRHVSIGQSADLIVIAPATANSLAKMAAGLADDLLGNTVLASKAPIVVAPAMHTEMWQNAATVANAALLASRGIHFVGPTSGQLTGADSGAGRMAEVDDIVAASLAVAEAARPESRRDLDGVRLLITAGGTREPLDPVRFIGNRSSGRQGAALAQAAASRGAHVTLIAAHVEVTLPEGVAVVSVETTAQLAEAVEQHAPESDAIIMAAAVADYRPAAVSNAKIKKETVGDTLTLELVKNPDILAGVAARAAADQIVVGFAAETAETDEALLELGRAKIARKGCDFLVVNRVGWNEGFATQRNAVTVLDRAGSIVIEAQGSKLSVADEILSVLAERLLADRHRTPSEFPGAP